MQGLVVTVMFCEDIREDTEGLYTLVNVYPDSVTLPSFPNALRTFGFYMRTNVGRDYGGGPIRVALRMPGEDDLQITTVDSEIIRQGQDEALSEALPFGIIISTAVASGFPIVTPVRVHAIAVIGDTEIVCGTLKFERRN